MHDNTDSSCLSGQALRQKENKTVATDPSCLLLFPGKPDLQGECRKIENVLVQNNWRESHIDDGFGVVPETRQAVSLIHTTEHPGETLQDGGSSPESQTTTLHLVKLVALSQHFKSILDRGGKEEERWEKVSGGFKAASVKRKDSRNAQRKVWLLQSRLR